MPGKISSLFLNLQDWTLSSWNFFRKDLSVQDITIFDFILQCLSFQFWTLYLYYTGVRCSILIIKYILASFTTDPNIKSNTRRHVWRQAQLYLNTKVLGIALSQAVLVILGLSTFAWAGVVILWGVFLSSLSYGAYRKASTLPREQ